MEIRAIIIDDESNSIENLATAIKEYASYIYVVGTSQTMTGGLRLWKNSWAAKRTFHNLGRYPRRRGYRKAISGENDFY